MTISQAQDPVVALAPMAGITDLPFRRLVARFGADLVVSEMVASREMVEAKASVRARAELGLGDAATAVQLAGREPHWMAEAARLVADRGARVIDINMGCPAKKVTGGLSGAALMREPDRALRLIAAVVAAVDVPVTVKMRLGWDAVTAPDLARRAAEAGVTRIVVHGRTRAQFYRGRADWAAVARVVAAVPVPVLVNGDILGPDSARAALAASGAAGVMVGRGAQGRPWLLARIMGRRGPPVDLPALVAEHYEAMLGFYGSALGVRVARKHLGWYMDAAGTPAAPRRAILTAETPQAVLRGLPEALAVPERRAA